MNPESSPFRPGQPIPIEFFVGRRKEVERLHGMVKASVRGNFKIGFVSGERGIGKSSLAHFVRALAEHESKTAGCHVFLGGVHEVEEMLRRTFDRLLKDSMDKPWHESIKNFFGNRIRKVGLFGVTLELNLAGDDLSRLAHDFVPSITQLWDQLKGQNEALLLILDDMNGLATSEVFANWLKSIVDEIATSRQHVPLCVLFVGLEERRRELVRNQPSLARVFELIDITPWSYDEVREFYKRAFESAEARVSAADLAMAVLVRFTGGLPVLAHELGDAIWRTAQSPDIDTNDIRKGIFLAAEVIGQKLLEPQVFQAIRSERYRSILRKMAVEVEPDLRFQRTEILARLTEAEKRVLNNFLRRMRNLGVLERDPEVRGGYRFPNTLYALYFMMEALRAGSKL